MLVRETRLESEQWLLLLVVSQRQPLGESSPIPKKTPFVPPSNATLVSPPDLISVWLAETSIIFRCVGSTARRFTPLRGSPLAGTDVPAGRLPFPLAYAPPTARTEAPTPHLHSHSWQAFGNTAARVRLWITDGSTKTTCPLVLA